LLLFFFSSTFLDTKQQENKSKIILKNTFNHTLQTWFFNKVKKLKKKKEFEKIVEPEPLPLTRRTMPGLRDERENGNQPKWLFEHNPLQRLYLSLHLCLIITILHVILLSSTTPSSYSISYTFENWAEPHGLHYPSHFFVTFLRNMGVQYFLFTNTQRERERRWASILDVGKRKEKGGRNWEDFLFFILIKKEVEKCNLE